MFGKSIDKLIEITDNAALLAGLRGVKVCVDSGRVFEALKAIRTLFGVEAEILAGTGAASPTQAA